MLTRLLDDLSITRGRAPAGLLGSILAVALFLLAVSQGLWAAPEARITGALLGGRELALEVVSTPDQMRTGLMFRDHLDENAGMLFVYPAPQPLSFWMKNTRLPLSIAFIRADGTIANVRDMAPFDEKTFHQSVGDCVYALEVNQGWFARHGVVRGQKVRFLKTVDDSGPSR